MTYWRTAHETSVPSSKRPDRNSDSPFVTSSRIRVFDCLSLRSHGVDMLADVDDKLKEGMNCKRVVEVEYTVVVPLS